MTAEYEVNDLDKNNQYLWEEFNKKVEGGTFFHTLKWKTILEKSFNYKTHYFMVHNKDEVISICPFYEGYIKGWKGLVLIPKSDYRRVLIDEQHCNDIVTHTILNKAKYLSKKNNLNFILIHTMSKKIKECFYKDNPLNYPKGGNAVLNLKENNPKKIWDVIFSERGDGTPRKYIRRFEKDGIQLKEAQSIDDVKLFYKYYKENLEFINVTPYPFSHFEYIWNLYSSSDMRITLLYKNEEIFGGLLAFIYLPKDIMYLKYLALNRKISNKYHTPYYLYWDAIINASEKDLKYLCFGATPNDINNVTYRTKMKFGSEYIEEFSMIFPLSRLFKLGYLSYSLLKRKFYRSKVN